MTVPDNLVNYMLEIDFYSNINFIFTSLEFDVTFGASKILCGFIVMVVDAGWMFVSILFRGVLAS